MLWQVLLVHTLYQEQSKSICMKKIPHNHSQKKSHRDLQIYHYVVILLFHLELTMDF